MAGIIAAAILELGVEEGIEILTEKAIETVVVTVIEQAVAAELIYSVQVAIGSIVSHTVAKQIANALRDPVSLAHVSISNLLSGVVLHGASDIMFTALSKPVLSARAQAAFAGEVHQVLARSVDGIIAEHTKSLRDLIKSELEKALNQAKKDALDFLEKEGNKIMQLSLIPIYGMIQALVKLPKLKSRTMSKFHEAAERRVADLVGRLPELVDERLRDDIGNIDQTPTWRNDVMDELLRRLEHTLERYEPSYRWLLRMETLLTGKGPYREEEIDPPRMRVKVGDKDDDPRRDPPPGPGPGDDDDDDECDYDPDAYTAFPPGWYIAVEVKVDVVDEETGKVEKQIIEQYVRADKMELFSELQKHRQKSTPTHLLAMYEKGSKGDTEHSGAVLLARAFVLGVRRFNNAKVYGYDGSSKDRRATWITLWKNVTRNSCPGCMIRVPLPHTRRKPGQTLWNNRGYLKGLHIEYAQKWKNKKNTYYILPGCAQHNSKKYDRGGKGGAMTCKPYARAVEIVKKKGIKSVMGAFEPPIAKPTSYTWPAWTRMPGSLVAVAIGPYEAWGVNGAGRTYHTTLNLSKVTWKHVPGTMKDIDCGAHGAVYAISVDGTLVFNDPAGAMWEDIDTPSKVKAVAVGPQHVYIITDDSKIWCTELSSSGLVALEPEWRSIPGAAVRISCGAQGAVYVVNGAGSVYYLGAGELFRQIPGELQLADIGVGTREVVGCNKDGLVYSLPIDGRGFPVGHDWQLRSFQGRMKRIASNAVNDVIGLKDDGQVFVIPSGTDHPRLPTILPMEDLPWTEFETLPRQFVQIEVGPSFIWGITTLGQIWKKPLKDRQGFGGSAWFAVTSRAMRQIGAGGASMMSVSPFGGAVCLNKTGTDLFWCNQAAGGTWQKFNAPPLPPRSRPPVTVIGVAATAAPKTTTPKSTGQFEWQDLALGPQYLYIIQRGQIKRIRCFSEGGMVKVPSDAKTYERVAPNINDAARLSVGANGKVYFVRTNDEIYHIDAHRNAAKLDGLLVDIAVAGREVVGCNANSNVYSRPVTTRGDPRQQTTGSSGWTRRDGELVRIAANANGDIVGIDKDNNIYRRRSNCDGTTQACQ